MIAVKTAIAARTANVVVSVIAVKTAIAAAALKNNLWQDQKARGGCVANPAAPVLPPGGFVGNRVGLP